MSKRSGMRKRRSVDQPNLDPEFILLSPPESGKKPRFSSSSQEEIDSSSSSTAIATGRLVAACDKASNFRQWSAEDVAEFLEENNVTENVVEAFREHDIHGRHLLDLNQYDLEKMDIKSIGLQKDILALLKSLVTQQTIKFEKVFNDPIHGHIELHPLMVKIIDTPQFQRLRHIKQLGGSYWVFPGAAHNRFEHSIGVGYLAGELVEVLQRKQPELDITDKDVLCVKIAGLCHDLGHGPFSHLFDAHFIPRVRPGVKWRHEEASVMMFEHLLEENDLIAEFERCGLGVDDITFIKEQIAGPLESVMSSQLSSDWPYVGRKQSKSFLYEVVANKRNGIDVDKWDYFARDCHCLGIPNNFDMKRFMKFARVINVKNKRQICTRDKEVSNLYEMFHTRSSLHRRAYQHKTSNAVEQMVTEALVLANDHFLLQGQHGPVKMSDAIYDPCAYTRLNDSIVHQILSSPNPKLKEAQQLLERIEKRQLYKCLGQTQMAQKIDKSKVGEMAEEIVSSLSPEEMSVSLTKDDLFVDVVTFDYGMKNENPIDHMRFYVKEQPHKPVHVRKDQVSQMLPDKFMEQSIRVYCKKTDPESIKLAKKLFVLWCQRTSCVTPKGIKLDTDESDVSLVDESGDMDFTPYSTPIKRNQGSGSGSRSSQQGQRTPSQSPVVVLNLNSKFNNAQ